MRVARTEATIARLRAELSGERPDAPVRSALPRIAAITARQNQVVAEKIRLIGERLRELAVSRRDATARDLADYLSARLGCRVWPETMYRPPYADIWRRDDPRLGGERDDERTDAEERGQACDGAERPQEWIQGESRRLMRCSVRKLRKREKQARTAVAELQELRRMQLLRESEADVWKPLLAPDDS